jgi:hypothetical protein
MNAWARLHALAASIAACAVSAYLAYWGAVGVRTWAPW